MSQFRAPRRYVQSKGVLAVAHEHLRHLDASKAVVAGGETALSIVGTRLIDCLENADVEHRGTVRGIEESTGDRIGDIVGRVRQSGADMVVGVGGTTATDAAKAAAIRTDSTFVVVPTLASADGSAASIAVLYDEDGHPMDVEFGDDNPALVLVDTGVIVDAPSEFLRWGLGDALATRFEVESCRAADGATIHDVEPTKTALPLSRGVYENIVEYGKRALGSIERGEVTPAVETIVETIHPTSVLAWENGGLAGAHGLETGLRVSGVTDPPHGPLVALCTLAETVWQDHPKRDELAALLADLGFEDPLDSDADLETGATMAQETGLFDNEPHDLSPELAVESLETARELLANARA